MLCLATSMAFSQQALTKGCYKLVQTSPAVYDSCLEWVVITPKKTTLDYTPAVYKTIKDTIWTSIPETKAYNPCTNGQIAVCIEEVSKKSFEVITREVEVVKMRYCFTEYPEVIRAVKRKKLIKPATFAWVKF